jgi:hypothetical protein
MPPFTIVLGRGIVSELSPGMRTQSDASLMVIHSSVGVKVDGTEVANLNPWPSQAVLHAQTPLRRHRGCSGMKVVKSQLSCPMYPHGQQDQKEADHGIENATDDPESDRPYSFLKGNNEECTEQSDPIKPRYRGS